MPRTFKGGSSPSPTAVNFAEEGELATSEPNTGNRYQASRQHVEHRRLRHNLYIIHVQIRWISARLHDIDYAEGDPRPRGSQATYDLPWTTP